MRSTDTPHRKDAFTAQEVQLLMENLPTDIYGLGTRLMLGTGLDDIIEAINHFAAIRYVVDHISTAISQNFIRKLHSVLTYGTYADRKEKLRSGEFRTSPNKLGVSAKAITASLSDLIKDYEKGAINMEHILDFHVRFEKIHPFDDYNGRVGRLIMLKECLRHGIDPFIIDDKRRGAYNRGIAAWSEDKQPLISVSLEAQKRFQGKMEICKLFQYARYPSKEIW